MNTVSTLDSPFLAPPGSYPPATVIWDYASTTVPTGFAEFIVPPQPGTPLGIEIPIVWSLSSIFFRTNTPASAGNTTLQIQRSTSSGAFSSANNLNDVPIIIPAGSFESIGRPYTLATFNHPLVTSFDKLRPVFVLGTGVSIVEFSAKFVQVPGQ
jgi:hypothetical protein